MDSFFVLSGLLISRGYQGMKSRSCLRRYATFLVRRIFRIWPMVVAAVTASVLIFCCMLSNALFCGFKTVLVSTLFAKVFQFDWQKFPTGFKPQRCLKSFHHIIGITSGRWTDISEDWSLSPCLPLVRSITLGVDAPTAGAKSLCGQLFGRIS